MRYRHCRHGEHPGRGMTAVSSSTVQVSGRGHLEVRERRQMGHRWRTLESLRLVYLVESGVVPCSLSSRCDFRLPPTAVHRLQSTCCRARDPGYHIASSASRRYYIMPMSILCILALLPVLVASTRSSTRWLTQRYLMKPQQSSKTPRPSRLMLAEDQRLRSPSEMPCGTIGQR